MPARQAAIAAAVTVLLCLFFGLFLFNGLVMLISPRAWLELPEWFPTSGYMRMRKAIYSAGWGALQVRILGLLFLGCVFGMFFLMFSHR
jgi:hypothetical protein